MTYFETYKGVNMPEVEAWPITTASDPFQLHTCQYCGGWHAGECPRVKAIEYHENGMVKRVEFRE